MSIAFTPERWETIRARYETWWSGQSTRPMLYLTTPRAPDRPPARLPNKGFTSHYGLDVEPADIVDVWDARLSGTDFLADGFPYVWINFGPGVLAMLLGQAAVLSFIDAFLLIALVFVLAAPLLLLVDNNVPGGKPDIHAAAE